MTFPWLPAALADLHAQHLARKRRVTRSLPGGKCEIEGRELWNFAGNDPFCLRHHPAVVAAAKAALDECGAGSGASALITGYSPWHAELENAIARFEGTESALLFPTGFAANVGTIGALVGTGDVVFCDRLNHASLVAGCKLSGAKLRVYRHGQLDRLRQELQKSNGSRRRLIVTDGLFSMDGDFAPLPELCDLADEFDAAVLVDEAHATGVFGTRGRGSCEHLGVEDRNVIRVGTLSKAIGALGGFVAGDAAMCEWLLNSAGPQVYSTALPPAVCAAATAAIHLLEAANDQRTTFQRDAETFRDRLCDAGIEMASQSHIVPVILGDAERTMAAAAELESLGFLVGAIRPPTVPRNSSRLRISLFDCQPRSKALLDDLAEQVIRVAI